MSENGYLEHCHAAGTCDIPWILNVERGMSLKIIQSFFKTSHIYFNQMIIFLGDFCKFELIYPEIF